jgi:hypothetical protein
MKHTIDLPASSFGAYAMDTEDLIDLLQKVSRLGLEFDVGNVYIRRSYIDQQTLLRARVAAAIATLETMNLVQETST